VISQIGNLLIETLFGFFIFLFLLRFYMQVFRAPFHNPIGEFVTTLTNWIVRPVRRVLPGFRGIDFSTLLLAWLFEALKLWLLMAMRASPSADAIGLIAGVAVVELLRDSIYLLIGVIIIQVILSWVSQHGSPFEGVLNALTRPFYRIFRRFIPPIGNIDLSPLFVLILAQIALILTGGLQQAVVRGF
jgi:YggT family protein